MSTLQFESPSALVCEPFAAADDEVRTQVWGLLAGLYPHGSLVEKREAQRYPYPRLVWLSPLWPRDALPAAESFTVAGKHISERGMSFYHPQPISHRLVVASLEAGDGGWLGFLLDLHRCRFTRHGWYETGGRFLRVMESPLNGCPVG